MFLAVSPCGNQRYEPMETFGVPPKVSAAGEIEDL
jgi:hypothetical protein